jgi:nucleoside-diphosphate-sugar epimerase
MLRVLEALKAPRDLAQDLPENFKAKIVALPSDLSLPSLGLEPAVLDEMLGHLTHIIHSAWAVNFNLPLLSFEPQHIRGVYNLLEHIALRTTHDRPAQFYFCSSVSVASGTPRKQSTDNTIIGERQIEDLSHAQHTGYGRSKLVAERITHAAMRTTGCMARVLRIGQLAGDTRQAVWNDTEAIALMIRSALPSSAGCLPLLNERPSWLPVDRAAEVIEQLALFFRGSDSDGERERDVDLAYHIVNPCTFDFARDLLPVLQAHPAMPSFEVVDTRTWLDRLGASDGGDVARNPSRKLLEFWEGKYGKNKTSIGAGLRSRNGVTVTEEEEEEDETSGTSIQASQSQSQSQGLGLTFDTTETVRHSRVLCMVRDPVGDGLMYRIVDVWMRKWNAELGAT